MAIRKVIDLVCDVCGRIFSHPHADVGSIQHRIEITRAAAVKNGWSRRPHKDGKLRSMIDVCGERDCRPKRFK